MAGDRELWTIRRILAWTSDHFRDKGIDSPRLEAELLLAHALRKNRVHLYTHFDQPLDDLERTAFRALVKRRALREPLAYITGEREFFSRSFAVSQAVLIPRPETEHVIEVVLAWVKEYDIAAPTILDVGTGSGVIAVTLAAELAQAQVVATDISEEALAVAKKNADEHKVQDRVRFLGGDLFAALTGTEFERFHVVVSNPPYVDSGTQLSLQPEVRDFEPKTALFAEEQGLAIIRRLCAGVAQHLEQPGLFACEIGCGQRDAVCAAAESTGVFSAIDFQPDLQSIPRVLVAVRK